MSTAPKTPRKRSADLYSEWRHAWTTEFLTTARARDLALPRPLDELVRGPDALAVEGRPSAYPSRGALWAGYKRWRDGLLGEWATSGLRPWAVEKCDPELEEPPGGFTPEGDRVRARHVDTGWPLDVAASEVRRRRELDEYDPDNDPDWGDEDDAQELYDAAAADDLSDLPSYDDREDV